ncbi:MAG TPA: 5-formyltetrahydrofolate cyclo-ligase [Candidatus Limnocylindrales bacterium]
MLGRTMSVTLEKKALRAKVLAARAGMAPEQLLAAADALFERLILLIRGYRVSVITCYVPMASEPGGPALPDRLATEFPSVTVLLPVLLPDLDLDWAPYAGPHSLTITERRLYEPTTPRLGPDAITSAQVVIVPALAADPAGHRLGRGGGSYDRALTRLGRGGGGGSYDRALTHLTATPDTAPATPRVAAPAPDRDTVSVALLHSGELLPHVPHEPHDYRVTHALEP